MDSVIPSIAPPKAPVVEPFPSQRTGIVQEKLHRIDVPKGQPRPAVSRNVPQHLRRDLASDDEMAALLDGAAMDAGEPPAQPTEGGEDPLDTILNRFEGTPEEKLAQMAKSYGASEKALRQLQNEKRMLLEQATGKPAQNPGMATTPPAATPLAQPAQMAPVSAQVTVNPFDYKKAGSTFLDDIEGTLKNFDEHQNSRVAQSINQVVQNLMVPMYDEMLQMKFSAQYPDLINEDSWPIIKVLASQSQGATDREKFVNGIKRYQKQMVVSPQSGNAASGDMADMRTAIQQPGAQASAPADKKIYKLSQIQKIMQRPDYGTNQQVLAKIDAAFAEGRVDRNS